MQQVGTFHACADVTAVQKQHRRLRHTHAHTHTHTHCTSGKVKKGKGSPYSITERRVPELIPVPGSQPLLSARPAVTPATLKRAATNFAAW